jgi:hypothetical protein
LSDDRMRSIHDYLSAADVFPGVGLKVVSAISFGTRKILDLAASQLISRTGQFLKTRGRSWRKALTSLFVSTKACRSFVKLSPVKPGRARP